MKTQEIKAISLALAGSLLTTFNSVGRGWAASVITIIGFVLFLVGLNTLKKGVDENGQKALGLIFIAVIIGGAGALFGLIPLVGIIGSIAIIVAFIMQLVGYNQLKTCATIGEVGNKGAGQLVISMIMLLVGGIFSLIPGVGRFLGPIFFLVGLYLIVFGWIKIQQGFIGQAKPAVIAITYILAGMLLQLGNGATRGWGAAVASLIGLIIFIIGLRQFRDHIDDAGKKAVKLILTAVYIGIAASVLDVIESFTGATSGVMKMAEGFATGSMMSMSKPGLFQIIVSLAFIVAFVVELLGLMKLKNSSTIGEEGKSGVTLLVVAMILAMAASLFRGIIPIGGNVLSSLFAIAGIFFVVYGWLKIQEAIASK